MKTKFTALITLAAAATLALAGCTGSGTADPTTTTSDPAATSLGSAANPIKIGAMSADVLQSIWLKDAAAKEGITIEFVVFSDYQQPNPATTSGEITLNQFQHILFLAGYNNDSGTPLVALQATAIYPLGLYSKQYTKVADLPAGAQVAIPNDETNQARALGVLSAAGLLQLKDGVDSLYATPLDIDEANSKVKVVPVSAEQTAIQLDSPDVAAAIINNDYAYDFNIDPNTAIARDDPADPASAPYINIWAGKAGIEQDPAVAKVLALAAQQAYGDELVKQANGAAVVVNQTPAALASILADVEAQLKAHA